MLHILLKPHSLLLHSPYCLDSQVGELNQASDQSKWHPSLDLHKFRLPGQLEEGGGGGDGLSMYLKTNTQNFFT